MLGTDKDASGISQRCDILEREKALLRDKCKVVSRRNTKFGVQCHLSCLEFPKGVLKSSWERTEDAGPAVFNIYHTKKGQL